MLAFVNLKTTAGKNMQNLIAKKNNVTKESVKADTEEDANIMMVANT